MVTSGTPRSVAVLGGGAVGLATAYSLQQQGVAVTVIESGVPGHGASWGNGGWLSPVLTIPTPAPGIPRMGMVESLQRDSAVRVSPLSDPSIVPWLLRFARRCTKSAFEDGSRRLAALSKGMFDGFDELSRLGVPIEVQRRGNLRACLSESEARDQLRELAPMRAAGFAVPAEILRKDEIHDLEPQLSDRVVAGFNLSEERDVDPTVMCARLTDLLRQGGAEIRSNTAVQSISVDGGRVRALETTDGPVTADAYVIAAGLNTRGLTRQLGVRLPLRGGKGYSFFVPADEAPSRPLYLSHTKVGVTPMADGYRVVGAMELADESFRINHRVVDAMASIARRFLRHGPPTGQGLSQLWAGMRPMTADGLPIIDRLPGIGNAYVNAGHGMTGVGLSMVSGSALADFVLSGQRPDALGAFTVDRTQPRGRSR